MKKGLSIAILVVLLLILGVLIYNAINGGIWILEGLNGANGKDGADGNDGKSAYELAVEDGFEGSLHDWLVSLAIKGDPGTDGTNGKDGANGKDGQNGVGVSDVWISTDGALMVRLTNGVILNAGVVGDGSLSEPPDDDGFTPLFEIVTVSNCYSLNLRTGPNASYPDITNVPVGTDLLRIGHSEELGWSRLVWYNENGEEVVCYANGDYLTVKYAEAYAGEIPEVHLPASVVIRLATLNESGTVDTDKSEAFWFITDEIVPYLPDGMRVHYAYSGSAEKVYNGTESFGIYPTKVGSATLTFRLEVQAGGEWQTVYEQTVAVTVVEPQKSLSLTGLLIGDSRISDGTLVNTLHADMPNLTFLGTLKSPGDQVPHEGRPGWKTSNYLNDASYGSRTNAFYNPSTGTFDFSYYMAQNYPDSPLDFVVINLGANDSFSEESVANIGKMVESIQLYAKNKGITISIFVMTEYLSPADGYYLTTTGNTNVGSIRSRQFRYDTYLTSAFAGKEDAGVYLLPNYLCIDGWNDRVRSTPAALGEEKITDVIHLGVKGYRKEARLIENYLFALFGE